MVHTACLGALYKPVSRIHPDSWSHTRVSIHNEDAQKRDTCATHLIAYSACLAFPPVPTLTAAIGFILHASGAIRT
eukprot:2133142-Rhodomonas_salina.2